MNNLEKIRSNIEVHGLKWAARNWAQKRGNFDTFYYAVMGKWPTRQFKTVEGSK